MLQFVSDPALLPAPAAQTLEKGFVFANFITRLRLSNYFDFEK